MRIGQIILLFTLLHVVCFAKQSNRHNVSDHHRLNASQSTSHFLFLKELIDVFQVEVKEKDNILTILKRSDKHWKYASRNEIEIAFVLKGKISSVVSWRFKDNTLTCYFFDKIYLENFNRQLSDSGFAVTDTKESADFKTMRYKKEKLVVKLTELLANPGREFMIELQTEPG